MTGHGETDALWQSGEWFGVERAKLSVMSRRWRMSHHRAGPPMPPGARTASFQNQQLYYSVTTRTLPSLNESVLRPSSWKLHFVFGSCQHGRKKCVIENVAVAQSRSVEARCECLWPLMSKPLEHQGCWGITGCHLTESDCLKCIRAGKNRVIRFNVVSFHLIIYEQIGHNWHFHGFLCEVKLSRTLFQHKKLKWNSYDFAVE